MHYDFSEQDQHLIDQVGQAVKSVESAPESKDTGSPEAMRAAMGRLSTGLANTSYALPGLEKDKPFTPGIMAAMENVAAAVPELFIPFEMSLRVVGRLIAQNGSESQKTAFLQPIQSGKIFAALALCEETMNVVNDPLATAGERKDNAVTLSGEKGLVIGGTTADLLAVVGRLDDGLGVFLLDPDTPGVEISDFSTDDSCARMAAARIRFEDSEVSPERVMGPFNEKQLLADLRRWESQVMTATAIGLMDAALFVATTHAKEHRSGGKPVIAYQEVGFKLAELFTLTQTSQLMAYKAGWMEETGDRELETFSHCVKVFCAEAAETVASGSLNILTNSGLSPANPAAIAYQMAKFLQMAGTSTEIARMAIGDAMLK